MKIKSSLGNEVEDRTGVHQGKLTTDNFVFEEYKEAFVRLVTIPIPFCTQ